MLSPFGLLADHKLSGVFAGPSSYLPADVETINESVALQPGTMLENCFVCQNVRWLIACRGGCACLQCINRLPGSAAGTITWDVCFTIRSKIDEHVDSVLWTNNLIAYINILFNAAICSSTKSLSMSY
ncbi:hypothetical protein EON65_38545 [archaeon]|nr:MAG: hypothetical protein EON65_38545 [archaeon]